MQCKFIYTIFVLLSINATHAKTCLTSSISFLSRKRWSGGATVLSKLTVPGVLLIWIRVGQGRTALAVGAGGRCLDTFLSSIISFFFSLSLGDGLI